MTVLNNDQWQEALVQLANGGLTGASTIESYIQNAIRNGQGYTATARNTSGGSNLIGLSVFNPSNSGKSLLFYSVYFGVGVAASISGNMIQLTTTDPALGTSNTPLNNKPGGAASVTTCSSANTNLTAAGTLFKSTAALATTPQDVLTNGQTIWLPSGAANGVVMYVTAATTSWGITISWLEV